MIRYNQNIFSIAHFAPIRNSAFRSDLYFVKKGGTSYEISEN